MAWVASASRPAALTRSGGRLLQEHLEGKRGERVTSDDGMTDAVFGPQGRAVPALEIAVDDVVVDKREVVDDLDRYGSSKARDLLGSRGRCRDEREPCAHELASAGEVFAHCGPQRRAEAEHGRVDGRCHD